MDCNVLRIVLGNDFPTRMTIKAVGIDGSPIPDFSLENSTDIVVKYKSASGEYEIDEYTIEGNNLFINWSGLGLGGYGFEITGVFNNAAWRYAARLIFRIVADQASANIPAGTLVNGVYLLDGWLAFLANTGSGGVESVNGKTGIVILTPEDIGAYAKPSTGIPKSDLASAVQASLNKADTALQNIKTVNNQSLVGNGNVSVGTYSMPSSGIPATDLASGVQTSLGKADSAYQKPSGGIPSSDLASAVQTSLGKADTAVQPAAIANLESKMAIVAASGTTLTASVDNYYLFGSEVGTLAITLTTPSDTTHITKAVFMLTTGSTPAVTFAGASGVNVIAQDGFSIEASTTYEINAIYNGVAWVVAAMKLSSTPINS